MKLYDRLQDHKNVATIYEMEDGRARIFLNEGTEDEKIIQYFKSCENAFDWLYSKGFLIW